MLTCMRCRALMCGTTASSTAWASVSSRIHTLVGTFGGTGLPDVQRSLNWVHLATRFPVRVRILAAETEPFRLSESAVVVMRPDRSGGK